MTPAPTTETKQLQEAWAYATGYEEGLRDAKEQDVATMIGERDAALVSLSFEKVLRQQAERERDECMASKASLFPLLDNERKNLATMQMTRFRLREYGKPTTELDLAIQQTEDAIAKAVQS